MANIENDLADSILKGVAADGTEPSKAKFDPMESNPLGGASFESPNSGWRLFGNLDSATPPPGNGVAPKGAASWSLGPGDAPGDSALFSGGDLWRAPGDPADAYGDAAQAAKDEGNQ
eukprot:gene5437-5444_t